MLHFEHRPKKKRSSQAAAVATTKNKQQTNTEYGIIRKRRAMAWCIHCNMYVTTVYCRTYCTCEYNGVSCGSDGNAERTLTSAFIVFIQLAAFVLDACAPHQIGNKKKKYKPRIYIMMRIAERRFTMLHAIFMHSRHIENVLFQLSQNFKILPTNQPTNRKHKNLIRNIENRVQMRMKAVRMWWNTPRHTE